MGNSNVPPQSRSSLQQRKQNTRNGRGPRNYSAFSPKQKAALMKRYQAYDPTDKGVDGIPIYVCLAMPEFVGNKLIGILIHDFANPRTGKLHPQEFLNFCSFLSPSTSIEEKKKGKLYMFLFDCFNVYETDCISHDELYRLYKVFLGHTISDDHILALTFKALQHPSLRRQGEIHEDEFIEMAPDNEVEQRLTVFFNIPPE
ncbi:calcineurin subunit B type 2 [Biomphalaria pfeifferi]|uniref:Calcineurin subunit B type 2 n=1 Tax=Biomphalaria pfeifferi TaxID=112525 RepID=A0AAD8BLX1_BIOPF|nr:calcineurin subunit B type 2 [Biomphalaria pfeifferi]